MFEARTDGIFVEKLIYKVKHREITTNFLTPSWVAVWFGTVLIFAIVLLGYTGTDDSHITYFVSDMLAGGHGIINHSGDPVEQSSSLLFTAVLALSVFLSDSLIAADVGPVLSLFFAILFFISFLIYLRRAGEPPYLAALAAIQGPFVYWYLSGMENSLYTALILILCILYVAPFRSRLVNNGAIVGVVALITLTRPEGLIVAICVSLGVMLLEAFLNRRLIYRFLLLSALGAGLAVAFRLSIGLEVFPNPVYMKQSLGLAERLAGGGLYFFRTLIELPITSVISLFAMLFVAVKIARRQALSSRFSMALASVILAVAAFAFLAGGDWMENGRFLVPVFAFAVVLLLLEYRMLRRPAILAVLALAPLVEIYLIATQPWGGIPVAWTDRYAYTPKNFRPAVWERYSRAHVRDLTFADRFLDVLNADPRDNITVSSIQAGMVPYYVFQNTDKTIRFVDMYGLASKEMHACPTLRLHLYTDWDRALKCFKQPIDYVFDIHFEQFDRVGALRASGCSLVFRDEWNFDRPSWKKSVLSSQYLVECPKVPEGRPDPETIASRTFDP